MTSTPRSHPLSRRTFLRGAAAAPVAGLLAACSRTLPTVAQPPDYECSTSAPDAASRPPNIVLILADDLGYGELGCYGQEVIQTPRLDELASQGMRFTQAYSGSTVCRPARSVLMTGLHTGNTPVRDNLRQDTTHLRAGEVTVADVLKCAGYRTGIFGKWALGQPGSTGIPSAQGFDEFFGYLDQTHAHEYYPETLWAGEEIVEIPENANGGRGAYSPDLVTERALDFIRRNQSDPFFLYLPHTLPHANNELTAFTGNGMQVPSDAPYSGEPWPQVERDYAAAVTYLDRCVGRVVDALAELGIADRTLVLFSSDNGPHNEGGHDASFFECAGPLRGAKRDLYEGGIRVPAIVSWPGVITPGVSDQVWMFADLLPTFAELAGVDSPEGLDGASVLEQWHGEPAMERGPIYWQFYEAGELAQAVRMGDWKLVRRSRRRARRAWLAAETHVELYHLPTDIAETRDLSAEQPDVVAEGESILDREQFVEDLPLRLRT